MKTGRVLIFALAAGAMLRCGGEAPVTADQQPPAAQQTPAAAAAAPSGPEPKPANELTKQMFTQIASQELGDNQGRVELRPVGILVHPGDTKPTTVNYRLDGKYKEMELYFYIHPLDADGQKVAQAGTVNVEVLVDGKSAFKSYVDRTTPARTKVDVANARELTVKVDNGNGKSWWDWLFMTFESAT